MLIDLIRVLLIDFCLILSLLLTFRLSFQSAVTVMCLRIGSLVILAEDVVRFTAGIGISLVDSQHYLAIDLVRSWASAVGAIGALFFCVGLLRVFKDKPRFI